MWPEGIHGELCAAGVRIVGYVPDAGHKRLIELCRADTRMRAVVLTTEEEGIGLAAGAWLGGLKSALLMQSSGVGNIVNVLGMVRECRFPLVTLVTMRGEYAEFNPWQRPMGQATRQALEIMGITVNRVDAPEDVEDVVAAALGAAFEANDRVAVLLGQRLIGRKKWESD